MEALELRMYGLVPYQLIGIQKGIQYGHSTDQYAAHVIEHIMNWHIGIEVRKDYYPDATSDESIVKNYIDWLKNWNHKSHHTHNRCVQKTWTSHFWSGN